MDVKLVRLLLMCPCRKDVAIILCNCLSAEPFLRECQLCSYSRTSQHFMEPEGLLPCSQEPSIGPHPQSDQSSPYHTILILSTHLRLGLPSGLISSDLPTDNLYAFFFLPIHATCTAHIT
jgi:hypothetical protein